MSAPVGRHRKVFFHLWYSTSDYSSKFGTHKRFGLSIGDDYQYITPASTPAIYGIDNLTIGAQYLIWKSDSQETLLTGGLNATLGNTGSTAIGGPSSVVSPTLLFGRGFGDLPSALRYLRPSVFVNKDVAWSRLGGLQ